MNYTITIFDINEKPMPDQPLELLLNGQVVASAVTGNDGVASFSTSFASQAGLAVRSGPPPSS